MRMFNRFDQKGRIRPVLAAITMGVAAVALLVPALPSHAANGIGGNFEIDTNANLVVDGTTPAIDWLTGGAGTSMRTGVRVSTDQPTGPTDDSFGPGTKD